MAASSAAWNGRGSITASTSPCFTSCPSVTGTCISVPSTRLRTCTALNACTDPRPLKYSGTSWRTLRATVTGTAAGGPCGRACCALDRSDRLKARPTPAASRIANPIASFRPARRGPSWTSAMTQKLPLRRRPSGRARAALQHIPGKPSLCLPGHDVAVIPGSTLHCRRNGGRPPASNSGRRPADQAPDTR